MSDLSDVWTGETMADELSRLRAAAFILARVHTRDDREIGFCVQMGGAPDWASGVSNGEYIAAWKTVREILGMPHEPEQEGS